MVIGFSGKIGSGKSTLSNSISKELNFKYCSFGDYIRKVAFNRGLENNRGNLQNLGLSLLQDGANSFCSAVLKDINWNEGESLIIDGIRHVEIAMAIKDIVSPDLFSLVFLKIESDSLRVKRNNISEDELKNIDAHPTESQVMDQTLLQFADIVIDANASISEQKGLVMSWIGKSLNNLSSKD